MTGSAATVVVVAGVRGVSGEEESVVAAPPPVSGILCSSSSSPGWTTDRRLRRTLSCETSCDRRRIVLHKETQRRMWLLSVGFFLPCVPSSHHIWLRANFLCKVIHSDHCSTPFRYPPFVASNSPVYNIILYYPYLPRRLTTDKNEEYLFYSAQQNISSSDHDDMKIISKCNGCQTTSVQANYHIWLRNKYHNARVKSTEQSL